MKPQFFSAITSVDSEDPTAEFYLIRDLGTLLPVRLTWSHGNAICHFQNALRVGSQTLTLKKTVKDVGLAWTHGAFVYLAMNNRLAEFRKQIIGNYYMVDVLPLRDLLEKVKQ